MQKETLEDRFIRLVEENDRLKSMLDRLVVALHAYGDMGNYHIPTGKHWTFTHMPYPDEPWKYAQTVLESVCNGSNPIE